MLRYYCAHTWRTCKVQLRLQHHIATSQTSESYIGLNVVRRVAAVRSSLNLSPQEVPSYDDLVRWRPVIESHSILQVSHKLQNEDAPTWVFLYLLSTKVHSPAQTSGAVNLMLHHLPKAEIDLRPALLILAARFLAKYQVISQMVDVVETFLMLDLRKPSSNFNLLLQAMSHFRPHPLVAKLLVRLLDAMRARQLRLHARTYRSLLSNKIVNLELTKMVQERMAYEGTRPNVSQLEAFLRVFGKHNAVKTASGYVKRIREEKLSRGELAPHDVQLSSDGAKPIVSQQGANTRWNTQFLRSFAHAGSAFHYLRELVGENQTLSLLAPPLITRPSRLATFSRQGRLPFAKARWNLSSSLTARYPVNWKTTLDIYDWTTALHTLSRDPHIRSVRLLALFKRSKDLASPHQPLHSHSALNPHVPTQHSNLSLNTNLAPTVATYTSVMRGLVKKKDYKSALEIWEGLNVDSRLKSRIDARALTVAMDVLVGNGRAAKAFDLLIDAASNLISLPSTGDMQAHKALSKRRTVKVDTPLVNALLSALTRHNCPDVACLLWEAFEPLFGVCGLHRDAETLGIALKAARKASLEEERSLSRVLARVNPFRRQTSNVFEGMSRQEIIDTLRSQLRTSTKGNEKAKAPIGGHPGLNALHIFCSILFSNYPRLLEIRAPAKAVWSDDASAVHPVRDFVLGVVAGRRPKSEDGPLLIGPTLSLLKPLQDSAIKAKEEVSPINQPLHPQITPTGTTFHAYIHLLGTLNRASEIPLALAWMRALDIRPTKRLLALSLVLWEEVSLRGPLVEQYESTSEFRNLLKWLEGWVRRDGLPTESMLIFERGKIRRERERLK